LSFVLIPLKLKYSGCHSLTPRSAERKTGTLNSDGQLKKTKGMAFFSKKLMIKKASGEALFFHKKEKNTPPSCVSL